MIECAEEVLNEQHGAAGNAESHDEDGELRVGSIFWR